jgi:hypothetical protein
MSVRGENDPVSSASAISAVLSKSPALRGAFSFYLRSPEPGPLGVNVDPLGEPLGARVFPEAFPALGIGPEGLGLLNVGIWFVEPTD